jgi:shikimate kinase
VIDDMTRTGCGVLATGGGAVLREANRALLRERTHVIYLRVTPEELFRRLRHDTQRPLLQVDDPKAKLTELFEQRCDDCRRGGSDQGGGLVNFLCGLCLRDVDECFALKKLLSSIMFFPK